MPKMVGRVAEAIMKVECDEKVSDYYKWARVAIEVMREPTPAMMDAGLRGFNEAGGLLTIDNLLGAYEAMIDEALAREK